MRRALLLVAACALSCSEAPGPTARNLILVSIDTLRPDMLGSYGYDRPTSPTLDALAARGALFETALSPAPWTLPAHASLLTGLYPKRHGLESDRYALGEQTRTLAELLAGHGFRTAAVVNCYYLSDRYGLHRGFRDYFYVLEQERRVEPSEVGRMARSWIAAAPAADRFFLFLHYYDVHSDYRSLPSYERQFVRPGPAVADGSTYQLRRFRRGEIHLGAADAMRLTDLYAAGIRQLDDGLARLLAALREHERLADTLLVITSDHGEEFLEHGGVLHGQTQFDEVLRVPLLLVGPGVPVGLRVREPASLIDVVPTVLARLGLPVPAGLDGVDLSPALRDGAAPDLGRDLLFGEATRAEQPPANSTPDGTRAGAAGTIRSVHDGRWKAILDPASGRLDLYDLVADPQEQRPVGSDHPEVAERLRAALEAFSRDAPPVDPSRALAPLDAEKIEALEGLGYF